MRSWKAASRSRTRVAMESATGTSTATRPRKGTAMAAAPGPGQPMCGVTTPRMKATPPNQKGAWASARPRPTATGQRAGASSPSSRRTPALKAMETTTACWTTMSRMPSAKYRP